MKFKGIQSIQRHELWVTTSKMKEYLSQISGIKKNKEMEKEDRKLKTKNVSKITIGDEQEHLVQSTDRARAVQV